MGIDPFLIAQAAQIASPQTVNPENYPRLHQPFQQESIPGAIIGALLQVHPVTKALGQNINDYRNRDVGPAMQAEAARQFRTIGSPEANHVATVIEQNPQVAAGIFAEYGGPEQTFMAMSQNAMMAANTQRENNLVQNWLATTPPAQRTAEALRDFALDAKIPLERATKIAELYGKMAPKPYKPTTAVEKSEEAIRRAIERGAPKEEIAALQDELMRARYGSATEVTWGPEGGSVRIGGTRRPDQAEITKATRNLTEQDAYNLSRNMQSLNNIMGMYRPAYQQLPTQLLQKAYSAASFLGADLNPQARQSAIDYNTYRSDIYDMFTAILKQLSGVAVNPQEYERIKKALPSPDDSPINFEGKMIATKRRMAQATARANYVRKNGLNRDDVPMSSMGDLIGDKMNAYYEQFLSQGMDEATAEAATDQAIMRDFGVRYEDVMLPWEK